MEPMIMGLGPLYSSEKLGSLVDVNNKYDSWYYKEGNYFWTDGYSNQLVHFVKLHTRLPVAVLISNKTGSSGEAVAISFIGNEQTKFFGSPTWGLTTGNGSFDLIDGANIHLASTIMCDYTGKKYYGSIQPDYLIENNTTGSKDIVFEKAIEWIRKKEAVD
jgi:carboxyl-terminal processing protease